MDGSWVNTTVYSCDFQPISKKAVGFLFAQVFFCFLPNTFYVL